VIRAAKHPFLQSLLGGVKPLYRLNGMVIYEAPAERWRALEAALSGLPDYVKNDFRSSLVEK